MTDVTVPEDLWDANKTPEGIVANWFYSEGATVPEGATLAELMVEKSSFDIAAPAAGTLRILVPKDGTVRPGSVIARLESG